MFTVQSFERKFFSLAPAVLVKVRRRGPWRKRPLDGALDFQSQILEHITTAIFVAASFFGLMRNPPEIYKRI